VIEITKPEEKYYKEVKQILEQWTENEEVEKYLTRIKNEVEGNTEYNQQFWLAVDEGRAIGVIGLADPLPKVLPLAQTSRPGEIKILYVDKKAQAKGVGLSLVEYVEKIAKEKGYSELIVRSAERYRDTAYGFYEHIGYVKRGVVPGGDQSLVMQVFGKRL
jgi:GNAT superfamily N-acetyltransferase